MDMGGLREIESALPPGFRFYPSDEELVCHYLLHKVASDTSSVLAGTAGAMVEVDLHTHEPWELPEVAKLSTNEWYFFSFRDRKYATGLRTNRATKSGYWKATGKDRTIQNPSGHGIVVGMRKTLVFYSGRAPHGVKTSWVMHEFRLENPHTPPKEDWVLCRVFHKKRPDSADGYPEQGRDRNLSAHAGPSHRSNQQTMPDVGSSSSAAAGEDRVDSSGPRAWFNLGTILRHHDSVEFPQEEVSTNGAAMSTHIDSSNGDSYRLLLDLGLSDQDLLVGDGGTAGLEMINMDQQQFLF